MTLEIAKKNKKIKLQLSTLQEVSSIAKINITTHINNALISDEIKKIILLELEEEKNSFYFCYASLFTNKNSEAIDRINIAGYFYYKYLIATDELVDNSFSKNIFKNLILTNFYHEESIRLLSNEFNSYPKFWEYWAMRKSEYLTAFQTDKRFLTSLTEKEFETLADQSEKLGGEELCINIR